MLVCETKEPVKLLAWNWSVSQPSASGTGGGSGKAKATSEGAKIFQDNCVACHQADGKGNQELGAPNLTDPIWLYGGDRNSVYRSIFYAHNGSMPAWSERLDDATIKMLATYVHTLGGGR